MRNWIVIWFKNKCDFSLGESGTKANQSQTEDAPSKFMLCGVTCQHVIIINCIVYVAFCTVLG